MNILKNWEKHSTIRNRPHRVLINDDSKYFFPITQQPICLHALVLELGEEARRYILTQSAYMFMQNIFINETEVVCRIAREIIQQKKSFPFSEEIYQNLLTVVIDETYHAYVANDFISQVSNITGIEPIYFTQESSLTRAIHISKSTLPQHCQFIFEIIATCIAENSITKELISTIKDPEVNPFFNEINADHLADEGRHCGIFLELLTQLWKDISDDVKKIITPCLHIFIYEYLNDEVNKKNDRKILSCLKLNSDDIENILYDTYPNKKWKNSTDTNPIVSNIFAALKKAGIFYFENEQHDNTLAEETILNLYAKQVKDSATQIAIVDGSVTLTYLELDSLSDRVAHKLKSLNLPDGAIIAIVHGHSFEYIPIIIGIMKAKMVFLPLSPQETKARLNTILDETQTELVISDLPHLKLDHPEFNWMSSSQFLKHDSSKIVTNLSPLRSTDLAYIIYTSGSSGRPKGVMITHKSLLNFAKSAANTFPMTKQDRVLQFCSYNFDASLADICASLISGARLYIRPKNLLDSSACFFKICRECEITLINLPATLLGQLIQDLFDLSLELPDCLKTVVIGGETLAPNLLKQWFSKYGNRVRLLNTYGPTETTIAVTACELNAYNSHDNTEKIIGKSFADAKLYVLDSQYRPLPIGAPGELYIGGLGVAKGYFNRPDLNAKLFFNDLKLLNADLPYSGRVYKTGDKVRWLDEENLEFIGRIDRQIKLRGFRIELTEIEHIINMHSSVASCFVIYRDKVDNPYLAAFILPKNKETKLSLKQHLDEHLPKHMHPNHIEFIDKWPLTSQGKIDSGQLINMLSEKDKCFCYSDDIHTRLSTIWKNLLKTQDINTDSHFFHLGGHSLLAMRLLAYIHREFQVQLTIRNIFEAPKFADMSHLIMQNIGKKNTVIPAKSQETKGPLSFAQEGLWLIDKLQSGCSIQYNIAFALHLKGHLDFVSLEKSINYIIERQGILRTFFQDESQVMQAVSKTELNLEIESITLNKFYDEVLTDTRTCFDLSDAAPLRIRLFQIHPEYFILLINHHHIIHDGYSIGIFNKELSQCYDAFCDNKSPKLVDLPRQYIDFAIWQKSPENECIGHSVQSLEYWCKQLKDYKPLHLPFRKSQAIVDPLSGNTHQFLVDQTITQLLRNICNKYDCSLFVGLVAILSLLFYRYTKKDGIYFATAMSVRDHEVDENLMGMFLNLVILRNKVTEENVFTDLLLPTKKTLIDATTYRYTPIELINKTIYLERLPFCNTLIDVCVNYHHFDEIFAKFESKTLRSEIEFIDNKTAKFGLSIDIFDHKETLLIKIEYCTELYEFSSIKKFAQDFLALTKTVTSV